MAESRNVSNIFLNFSKKLKDFTNAEQKNFSKTEKNDSSNLQESINRYEDEKESRILEIYSSFRIPASKAVEEDEEALVKAYELFKSVLELNKSSGSEKVFIKSVEIENPISKKDFYAGAPASTSASNFGLNSAGKFIYLQIWFCFEKNITDFVPYLEQSSSGRRLLKFEPYDEHHFSIEEKEIIETIRKNLYS